MGEKKEQIDIIADAMIEIGEKAESNEDKLEKLERKLNSFCMAVLKNLPPDKAKAIFKEYHKNSFKDDV